MQKNRNAELKLNMKISVRIFAINRSEMRSSMGRKITMYILRHGRQNSALCNVNVPLSEAGERQSELAGQRLSEYNIDALYSSNLIRAVQTAEIINRNINVHNRIIEGLEEIDFGELTGLEDSVIKEKYKDYFDRREEYREDIAFPGGEDGKTVYVRMKNAIDTIIDECKQNDYERVAIVSHGGAIRAFLAGILGMEQSHRFLFAKTMENTSITQIDYDVDKDRFYVERINDYSHIEGYPELMRVHFI